MELEERVPLGGDALGKEPHAVARLEHRMHLLVDARGVAPLLAANEDGARLVGDPAGDRPVADLALRDEARGARARDEEDVEPGDVVGGDHRAGSRHRALHARGDTEDAQELPRPPPQEGAATVGGDARIREAQQQRGGRRVAQHARPADGTERAARLANA